ncbi:MAG: AAA family ATPase [Bacteroidales bacterium]|nr:AAA family ATPase [Bacteroidales bacterium]
MNVSQQVQQLLFAKFPHIPTEGQIEACRLLTEFLFNPDPLSAFVLKGYAGTGKTTLVSALIQTLPALKVRSVLLAPTGRAAKVLSNYSGRQALTIHKKIYATTADANGLLRCSRIPNKHSYTLFIVDEASMIGEDNDSGRNLLDDMVSYVKEGSHCRLMLIGDTAQLPPVGSPISPALDCKYLQTAYGLDIHSCELTEVVRQAEKSGILHNSTLIRKQIANDDIVLMPLFELDGYGDISRINGAELEEILNQEYSDKGSEEVVLICRTNKRANIFNNEIRNRILFRDDQLCTGDYLMVVKNNYFWSNEESGIGFIANGDIAEILRLRNFEELYGFRFATATLRFIDYPEAPEIECKILLDTLYSESPSLTADESRRLYEQVALDYADLPTKGDRQKAIRNDPYYNALQVKFAYALTCHKTQGGQWDTAIIDQGFLPDDAIDREYLRWLYTALTRAKKKVYLLNFKDDFFEEQKE